MAMNVAVCGVEALEFLNKAIISGDDLLKASTPKVVHCYPWSYAVHISQSPNVAHLKKKVKSD